MEKDRKIRLLMLVTYFAPDSNVSSVRPSMLARYLAGMGYDITVLRSGRINGRPDDSFGDVLKNTRVLSYDGADSPAERYARGEWQAPQKPGGSGERFGFIKSSCLRRALKAVYDPIVFLHGMSAEKKKMKAAMERELAGESFDLIFASYGDIGNLAVAPWAKKRFNCKLIMDFRDSAYAVRSGAIRAICRYLQWRVSRRADRCTCVCHAIREEVDAGSHNAVLLRNGFAPTALPEGGKAAGEAALHLVYSGSIYSGRSDLSAVFCAIRELCDGGEAERSKFRLDYAGHSCTAIYKQAESYGLGDIVVDHGYLARKDVHALQAQSDIFLVASWNTQKEQGILTGKFYEAIQNKMPVVAAVTGDLPHSELRELIEGYSLGVCCELADFDATYGALRSFLKAAYDSRLATGRVAFEPSAAAYREFSYENIAQQLHRLISQLL